MDQRRPIILDCTIRDGSYAIDFKFTASDSALLTGLLDNAGVAYIEVGHGLGLGATEAGKGRAASHDVEVVRLSVESVRQARVGAFFIPGIGNLERLREAADAGLHFVRIGNNADEMDQAWPYVEAAREAGLEVFVNLMKTYGISPAEFGARAREAASLGAKGIYVVDSAGGMMPGEVTAYVEASLEAAPDLAVGFHGHSNLHLAVANSLAAYEAGGTFVDTSVFGIGRSSGNVPTEVMAGVFDRLGVDCGIDAMEIIEIAESYVRPLAEHLHPHDMVAVSLGYGRFHSSFLPRALRAAREADISPFRLIVALGRRDMMRMSDDLLAEVTAELAGRPAPPERLDLARFSDARFTERRIGNRPEAVAELLDGLGVVAAKRHLALALDLVHGPALDEETVTAEFLMEDDTIALGRVRYGAPDTLLATLQDQVDGVELVLCEVSAVAAETVPGLLADLESQFPGRVVPYRSAALELEYLGDVAEAALIGRGEPSRVALVDAGQLHPAPEVDALADRLRALGATVLRSPATVAEADLLVATADLAEPPPDGTPVIYLATLPPASPAPDGMVALDRRDAYRDRAPRWLRSAQTGRAHSRTRLLH